MVKFSVYLNRLVFVMVYKFADVAATLNFTFGKHGVALDPLQETRRRNKERLFNVSKVCARYNEDMAFR